VPNYASLFIGEENTVAYGDKGVRTNHTLPIGKAHTGGLLAGKFVETVTYQRLTPQASRRIEPAMGCLDIEGMLAHELTATVTRSRPQCSAVRTFCRSEAIRRKLLPACLTEREWRLIGERPDFSLRTSCIAERKGVPSMSYRHSRYRSLKECLVRSRLVFFDF
jgi:Histidinol dehydrogenase